MRTTTLLLAAALFTAAPLAAQNTALVVGRGRATVRVETALTIPAFIRAAETQTLTETFKGNGYTEYLATYTVRANTRWDLVATAMPEGVTILAQDGEWTAGAATIGNGDCTNGDRILVRVRVTTDAATNWREQLQLEAQRGF
jgi:hypothetical protein